MGYPINNPYSSHPVKDPTAFCTKLALTEELIIKGDLGTFNNGIPVSKIMPIPAWNFPVRIEK